MRSLSLYHPGTGPYKQLCKIACFFVLIMLVTVAWTGLAAAAPNARITNMTINSTSDSVLLYFDVENVFNEKLITAVNSGLTISFSFPINIYQVRNLWRDIKINQLDLTNTIKYDTLKKEYIVTRSWKNPDPVKVDTFEEAAALMTRIEGLSLTQVKGLVKGGTYKIKAKAQMNKVARPKYLNFILFFLDTWKLETRWNAVNFIY
jgi:hypothetical protein